MRSRNFILIVALVLPIGLIAQCCKFEIVPSINTTVLPENEIVKECWGNNHCDKRYLDARELIIAYRTRKAKALDEIFESFNFDLSSNKEKDELELKIIYQYGMYKLLFGEVEKARILFDAVSLNTVEGDLLNTLSKIKLAGISKSIIAHDEIEKYVINQVDLEHNFDHKALMILELTSVLTENKVITYLNKYEHLTDYIKNRELRYRFICVAAVRLSFGNRLDTRNYEKKVSKAFRESMVKEPLSNYYRVLMQLNISRGDVIEANEYAKRAVVEEFGEFKDYDGLKNIIKSHPEKYREFYIVEDYARSVLYLSSRKGGIEAVKEAFEIYETVARIRLVNRILEPYGLTTTRKVYYKEDKNSLLVIANYLYNVTGGIEYLNKAISLTDIYHGGSVYSWRKIRGFMRENDLFKNKIQEIRLLRQELDRSVESVHLLEPFDSLKNSILSDFDHYLDDIRSDLNIDLHDVQKVSSVDTSMYVSFYLNSKTMFRVIVTRDSVESTEIKNSQKTVYLIKKLMSNVYDSDRLDSLNFYSQKLYQRLFSGVDISEYPRIKIIATDYLTQVPFSLLLTGSSLKESKYLGLQKSISQQYSFRSDKTLNDVKGKNKQSSVLGFAPTFNNELLAASELRQSGYVLPPLSYNQEELTGVENLGKGNYHYGKRATLSEFREEAPNHSILHFATHAISSKTDGLRSRVYLMDEAGDPAPLYASDIGNETLNADLVTLSACETGGGSQNLLEGTIGLTKAFLAAGARSVVASNWAVDDFATAELMESFYAAIRKGKAPDQALQYARKAYVTAHPGAHPSRWAAFEAYGGMVSPAWDEKAAWYESIWTYLGGFLLLLLGGLAYKRMRYA